MRNFLYAVLSYGCAQMAFAGPAYFQLGVGNNAQDDAEFTGTQGASSEIYATNDQSFTRGSFHFFWVASGLDEVPGKRVFVQTGYAISKSGGRLIPFIYSNGSIHPHGDQWLNFVDQPMRNKTWYTFAFQTDSVRQPDGSYLWTFTMQPRGGKREVLAVIPFATKNTAQAPYLVSEVAGAEVDACADRFSVTYGHPGELTALLGLKRGEWLPVTHGHTFVGYGPCSTGEVGADQFQQVTTRLGSQARPRPYQDPIWRMGDANKAGPGRG